MRVIKNTIIPATRTWGGREMLTAMDQTVNSSIFIDLYNAHIYNNKFPVDDAYWKKLGVLIDDGEVYLTDNAPWAEIRKQIIPPQNRP